MRKNLMRLLVLLITAVLLICGGCGSIRPGTGASASDGTKRTDGAGGETDKQDNADDKAGDDAGAGASDGDSGEVAREKLTVHYLDVGQGDCTLITCGGEAMLIDAGGNDRGMLVRAYLNSQNIKRLKYVIGTHPDADHIGGLDVVIYNFECENIFLADFVKDTKTYDDVIQTIKSKNYKYSCPVAGDIYTLGTAKFEIVAPVSGDYGDDANNYSIGIRIMHGDNVFLFTGDAEEEAENDMLASGRELDADVFQAGHHGSSTSNTERFLQAVSPEYVVISCGEGNSYGHPHAEVLNELRTMGVRVFRTDEQGAVIAVSDGRDITFNCSPSDSWQSGERK